MSDIMADLVTFRNVLSYLLQKFATKTEANALERILSKTSSAYMVEISSKNIQSSSTTRVNSIIKEEVDIKLIYRVAPIVKKQALNIIQKEQLLNEAWNFYYSVNPDDEKTVVRCSDAIAGLLRDKYFPGENKTQLGTMLGKMRDKPENYPMSAEAIFNKPELLNLMRDFSKIRGNHKTGTGRAPTHEEAGFVLHYSIMLFQLLKF